MSYILTTKNKSIDISVDMKKGAIPDVLTRILEVTPWLNMKNNYPREKIKFGECHAIAYGFHVWHKYGVRKFSRSIRFTFRVIKVYQNPTGTCSFREKEI